MNDQVGCIYEAATSLQQIGEIGCYLRSELVSRLAREAINLQS